MRSKTFHWSLTGWTIILFYAVCGLLLLLWPDLALKTANFALAAVLCVVGLISIVDYLRGETINGILGFGLAKGLILLMVGVGLMIRSNILINLLPFLWGVAMIVGGFAKVQIAFDLKRVDRGRWWLMLLGALISFLLGIIAVSKSVFFAYTVTQIAGISLLVEAALDVVALLTVRRELKIMKT
ncbi:MAG: DUF308 domain-containing protein [Eubacteriales bacterium]|nr:DUF308 domain-containing protein [Eubacteriales bacterium]